MIRAQVLERSLAVASARQPLLIALVVAVLLAALTAVVSWAWPALAPGGTEEVLLAPFRWGPGDHSPGTA